MSCHRHHSARMILGLVTVILLLSNSAGLSAQDSPLTIIATTSILTDVAESATTCRAQDVCQGTAFNHLDRILAVRAVYLHGSYLAFMTFGDSCLDELRLVFPSRLRVLHSFSARGTDIIRCDNPCAAMRALNYFCHHFSPARRNKNTFNLQASFHSCL